MADSESEEQPKKKKAMKKLVLVKPNTRSTSQQFGSDADEVNALIRVLEDHLEGSEGNEDIPQVDINDLRTEIQGISKELIDEKTTVKKILPRLRHIATIIKLPGASKTSKGRWLYSEEIREEEKAISRAKERPEQTPTSQKPSSEPESPNLLESSQENEPPGEKEQDEESQEESQEFTQEFTQQATNTTSNLERNPYYDPTFTINDNNSESSSNKEDEQQGIPPQEPISTQEEEEKEHEEGDLHLNMFTIAGRARTSKQESDVFKEKIKSGLRDLDNKKKQLEQSLTAKVQEAKEKLKIQATERHESFTSMLSNTMNQYKENVQNLVTNKMQELHSVTDKWKESYERAVKLVHDRQGKLFEKRCKETQKQENDKAEKFQLNQERKLKTTANEIEADLLNQAQSLLDQLPMDMGEVKEELESQLRAYGDQVREGIETAHNEKHLQQMGESLMKELQQQAAGHKMDMHNMATNRGAGAGKEYSTLPTHAQYMERKRLRNEIVTEIRNDLGMNTADAEWTKVRREINLKIDTEISMVNNTNEEVGARLALTEVLVDQMDSKFETIMTARMEERIQEEWQKFENDRNETKQMQHRILDLETQQIQIQGKGKILEQ